MADRAVPRAHRADWRFRIIWMVIGSTIIGAIVAASSLAAPVVPPWRMALPWTSERAIVTVGETTVLAEIADTGALRQRGLSYRDGLAPGTGMLFVDEQPRFQTFWMKDMRFCLDIIWIEGGRIVGAATEACPHPHLPTSDLPTYRSPIPVRYVLEVPAGWLAEHGYGEGTPVTIELPDPSVGD